METIIFSNRDKTTEAEENWWGKTIFSTRMAPKAIWPYSLTYKAWNLIFCSWQIAIDPQTMQLVTWWIENETIQVCRNIKSILWDLWIWLKDVVKTTIFLKNIWDFEKVNNIYKDYFILKPARSTVEVSNLPRWALIEIEVIALNSEK
jgi:2-iminobutanoate/2-iminopropanoate deaminase